MNAALQFADKEQHDRMIQLLSSCFLYEVSSQTSHLKRYFGTVRVLKSPMQQVVTRVATLGNSRKARPKYEGFKHDFYESRDVFVSDYRACNDDVFSWRRLSYDDVTDILGYSPDLSVSKDSKGLLHHLSTLLNNNHLDLMRDGLK